MVVPRKVYNWIQTHTVE